MHFLAHDAVLPADAPPLVRLGAALPDLWPLLDPPPLPLLLVRGLDAEASLPARQLAAGIRAHLRADAAFHRHPEFHQRVLHVAAALGPLWPALPEPELAAHLLVELLLDRWLVERDPTHPARWRGAFTPDAIAHAAHLGAADASGRAVLARVLAALGTSDMPARLVTADGLLGRFSRAWSRTAFARPQSDAADGAGALDGEPPRAAISPHLDRWFAEFAEHNFALLADVRAALDPIRVLA